eukprot:gene10500-3021_t
MRLIFLTLCIIFALASAGNTEANWITISRKLRVGANKGYGAVDYSPYANQIKGSVICSNSCDGYLVTQTEYHNLINGRQFSYLQSQRGTTNFRISLYTNTIVIRKRLYVVIVNNNDFPIDATFELQQDVLSFDGVGIFRGFFAFVMFFCVTPCCLLFCCVAVIVCAVGLIVVLASSGDSSSSYNKVGEVYTYSQNYNGNPGMQQQPVVMQQPVMQQQQQPIMQQPMNYGNTTYSNGGNTYNGNKYQ